MDMTRALMLEAGKSIIAGREKFVAPYAYKNTFFVAGKDHELDAILDAYDGSVDVILKTHAPPTRKIIRALKSGRLKATFTHREPHDAVLSILDAANRDRALGRVRGFDHIKTLEHAIVSVRAQMHIVRRWLRLNSVLSLHYSEVTKAPVESATQIVSYLGLELSPEQIREVVKKIDPKKGHEFNVGETGRWRAVLSPGEIRMIEDVFGEGAT